MNDLQVSWVGSLTRQNSLSSSNCQPTPSQHQQLTPQNSLSSYHSSVYNGGRGGHSSSLQYDDNSKPINNLTARGTLFITNVSHSRNVDSYLAQLAWYLEFSYEWKRDRGSTVVKVLCYKSESQWFYPSWCRWIFH